MAEDVNEKLEKMLKEGKITSEMYEEIRSRWNEDPPDDKGDNSRSPEGKESNDKRSLIKISGSGVLSNPESHEIRISGSARIEGSAVAEIMNISGSAKIEGSLTVKDVLSSLGSLRAGGAVTGKTIVSSGSIRASSLKASMFKSSGGTRIEGKIEVDNIASEGRLNASEIVCHELDSSGTLKADTITGVNVKIHGAIVSSNVKAESFMLESMGWGSDIGMLAAEDIVINSRKRVLRSKSQVTVKEINGKKVDIESVRCGRIIADEVVIGDNCTVDYVEAERISLSEGATVKEKKIRAGVY